MKGVKVLVYTPKIQCYVKDVETLQDLQDAVGEYFEIVRFKPELLGPGVRMIVNEEGHLLGLPINPVGTYVYGHGPIFGDIAFSREAMGPDGYDLVGLTEFEIKRIRILLGF